MSWKNARTGLDRLARLSISPGSITARLSALFALSSFAILVLAAIFLYVTLKEGIYNDDVNSLKEQMEWIETVLRQDPNLSEIQSEGLRHQYSRLEGTDYVMRTTDESGRIIYETPGLSDLLPSKMFSVPSKSLRRGEIDPHPRTKDRKTYVVAADVINVEAATGGRRIIELAYDAS